MANEFSSANATVVDSNILLDLFTRDETWLDWSREALQAASNTGPLVINPIIYSEVSVHFSSMEALDELLLPDEFIRQPLPWSASFLAGKCFTDYRKRGGTKRSPLPDFYIGAHAAVQKYRLLTREAKRFRTYFPTVELIAPE